MVTQRNSKSGKKESKESKEYEEFKEATVVGHASRFLNSGSSPCTPDFACGHNSQPTDAKATSGKPRTPSNET
jgi:hypothetical protein